MPPRKPKQRAKPAAKKPAPQKVTPKKKKATPKKAAPKKAAPQEKETGAKGPAARTEAKAPGGPTRAGTADAIGRLRRLCEAVGVSGDESAVRRIVLEEIDGHVDEVHTDTLGNVIAVKKGGAERAPRVMVTAHMDEVGLMVVAVDSDGLLKVDAVGGLDQRVLLGKPVLVGRDRIPGVIGAKPVHLMRSSEAEQIVKMEALRVDIGAASKEAAARKVKPGDRVTFAAPFSQVGGTIRARALDNRTGCAALIELLRGKPFACDLWAAFTVQEEIGLRGARVAAFAIDPMAAFVLEGTVCDDLPKEDEASPTTELGKGPALSLMDRTAIANRRLVEHLAATARALDLPYQIKQPGVGGTDAGSIHLARAGVPVVAVAVPCRYIHSPLALMSLADYQNEIALLRAALERFTPAVLKRKG